MPEYLITGLDENGKRVTELIKSATAEDALEILKARGYSDVSLYTDEVQAALFRPSEHRDVLSNAEILAIARAGPSQFYWWLTRKLYRMAFKGILFAIGMALLGYVIFGQFHWALAVPVVLVLALTLAIVAYTYFFGASEKQRALFWAVVEARWNDVLERASNFPELPVREAAYYKARALVGLGRVDDGLREYESVRTDLGLPKWMYWARRGDLLEAAHQNEEGIACREKAVQVAPDNPVVLLGLAMAVLRHRHDTARGRELLAKSRSRPISDTTRFMYSLIEGLITLYESKAGASEHLEQALREMAPVRVVPLALLVDATVRTYLAIALARDGDREAAEREFRIAEPLIRVHDRGNLLREYEAAIGAS